MEAENLSAFLMMHEPELPDSLRCLEEYCLTHYVPVIRRETQGLLRVLLAASAPRSVLEIGTACGFSSLFMCHYSDAQITTIEHDPERAAFAACEFEKAGMSDRVTLLKGNAEDYLPKLQESYDLVFLDGAKGQYESMLPDILRLLKDRGLLISDNVLMGGDTPLSRYAVDRRNRTIHKRMREYLYTLTHDPSLETVILSEGDGMAITVKYETS